MSSPARHETPDFRRAEMLRRLEHDVFDVVVVGGGIAFAVKVMGE